MIRYDIVLHAAEQERFVNELRELGLVDITTTGWEPSEGDRALLSNIDAYNKALEHLSSFASTPECNSSAMVYASGAEAYECYDAARAERQRILQEVARLEKQADEVAPWDDSL
jgi:V/A-type H+-transporting ATPase subunit I